MIYVPSEEESKRSKNYSTNSEAEKEDLIGTETENFIAKEEREVIKVSNCTYSNEAKTASKYFLCIC